MRLEVGGLVLDDEEMAAHVAGRCIDLTASEFSILYKLASNPHRILSRSQLEEVPCFREHPSRAIDIHIANIRKKLGGCEAPKIVTVYGFGYKLVLGK